MVFLTAQLGGLDDGVARIQPGDENGVFKAAAVTDVALGTGEEAGFDAIDVVALGSGRQGVRLRSLGCFDDECFHELGYFESELPFGWRVPAGGRAAIGKNVAARRGGNLDDVSAAGRPRGQARPHPHAEGGSGRETDLDRHGCGGV